MFFLFVLPIRHDMYMIIWGYIVSWILTAILYLGYYAIWIRKERIKSE